MPTNKLFEKASSVHQCLADQRDRLIVATATLQDLLDFMSDGGAFDGIDTKKFDAILNRYQRLLSLIEKGYTPRRTRRGR